MITHNPDDGPNAKTEQQGFLAYHVLFFPGTKNYCPRQRIVKWII